MRCSIVAIASAQGYHLSTPAVANRSMLGNLIPCNIVLMLVRSRLVTMPPAVRNGVRDAERD